MQTTNIHNTWGAIIEFDDPYDFFTKPYDFWRNFIYEKKLLIFKKMHFTTIDYVKFSTYFGQPWLFDEYVKSGEPYTITLSDDLGIAHALSKNITLFGNNKLNHRLLQYHADIPNDPVKPYPFRSLWPIKNPYPESGQTFWLNIEDCFNLLSPKLTDLISRVTVLQQNWNNPGTGFQKLDFVKTHRITKNKSLRLNYATDPTAWIKEVYIDNIKQPDNSLIQEYIEFLMQFKQLYYQHKWDLFDIAIYDNYCFIHGRTPVTLGSEEHDNSRILLRINMDHQIYEDHIAQKNSERFKAFSYI